MRAWKQDLDDVKRGQRDRRNRHGRAADDETEIIEEAKRGKGKVRVGSRRMETNTDRLH